jgi:addiction module HigA family antidote
MAQIPIHPGEHLALELEELGMSASELARHLQVPANRITAVLKGQRSITADTALRLAHFFGTAPEFWLNLQSLYDLRIARQQAGKAISGLPSLKALERMSA